MDSAFSSHLDLLIQHLKIELLQHYERDLAAVKGKQPDGETFSTKPHILGLQRKAVQDGRDFSRNPRVLLNRRCAPDSDSDSDELELWTNRINPTTTVQPVTSKSETADVSDASGGTAESLELKTPKPGSRAPKFPKPEGVHPFSPHTPPEMLPAQVIPVSDALALPHQPVNGDDPQPPAVEKVEKVEKETEKEDKPESGSESAASSASFSSTSTPNDEMPERPPPSRCRVQRPSNASFSEFFKRQATVTELYLFMQDEDSSTAAWLYAKFMNYFMAVAILFTVWQANAQPVVPRFTEGVIQSGVEGLMLVELLVHFFSTRRGERMEFLKNPHLIILKVVAFQLVL